MKRIIKTTGTAFHNYEQTGDYTRLRQMLLAVSDNAVKFTHPGRSVRLWLEEANALGMSREDLLRYIEKEDDRQ